MIHHELGYSYFVDEEGTKVAVEARTPADMAMAAEDRRAPGADSILCAIEAVRDWLAWIYEAGPHPVPVMRRLVACTSANAPWLLQGLPKREAKAIGAIATEAESLRVVCGAVPSQVRASISKAYRREGRTWESRPHIATIEMQLLLESAVDVEDSLVRAKAMETWLGRIWDGGPRLGAAMKALYVDTRALAPELILNMSGDEIADLFAQGRAAESARVKQRVNRRLLHAGFRHGTLRFQKSATACRTYAESQRGNTNRADGARAAKASAA